MVRTAHPTCATASAKSPSPGRWEGDGRGDRGEVSGGGSRRVQSPAVNVPILDLTRVRRRIATQLDERWRRILDQSSFVLGPEVKEFESAFASWLGVEACAGLANGTDALILSLRALGLKPGDEVIVPAFSFFATAEVVALLGGKVVFCDVDPQTLNLSPADVEARITERT